MKLEKIQPTAKQNSILKMHAVAFVIINAILWYMWYTKPTPADGFKYPIHIWMTSAWFLSLIAHWAALHTKYTDPGMSKYEADAKTS
jgi:2TM domain